MASGKIVKSTPVFFSLGGNSSLSASGGTGIYFPDCNCVAVFGGASNSSDFGTGVNLATIPEKYRPSSLQHIMGRFNGTAGTSNMTPSIDIRTDGNIRQGATSVARCVDFWGVYPL